ncbi:MAG TPA: BMP family ABC transporter substrate-binding protein [Candidatus Faecousia intestinigallinarum]|nr:BMP family ABC transporter substrate-binding protein [Candidatus Faecousia intestinigallinarum]
MYLQEAKEEYTRALRLGQKEYKERSMAGKDPYPVVLDEILGDTSQESVQIVPLTEIPVEQIVGIKSRGRISAFTQGFLPLLEADSEFAAKWVNLCAAHLSEGIRDPILCFEYLGNFYVQEGNKRLSVLKYFGAARIPSVVHRILPAPSQEPRIRAYYEFLEFYKSAGIYEVQFRRPGDYAKLLASLGKEPGEEWTDREKKTFTAYFQYFKEAFFAQGGDELDMRPEDALLLFLEVYPFRDLGRLSGGELKKLLSGLWDDLVTMSQEEPVKVLTEPSEQGKGVLGRLISSVPDHLEVAFIHQRNPSSSVWTKGHDDGRIHLEQVLPGRVTVRSYFDADTQEQAEELLDLAVLEGAQVVFTTTPQLSRATLKAAVKYPKVRFLNCSADTPFSSVRSYYCREFEGKFITGAIAGAIAKTDRVGYVGSYPILGVPASINAFALGAQMTNPRVKVELRWSCQPGNPTQEFIDKGIRVISNRDIPTPGSFYLHGGEYGTYLVEDSGKLTPLASPCYQWGRFYENVVRSILSGAWENKGEPKAVNYWWGLNSSVIDVRLAKTLPNGVAALAEMLRKGLQMGLLDPFRRYIVAQDGSVKNEGERSLTPDAILRMDWLCENVEGRIPEFEEVLPMSQALVRELGVHRDRVPKEKEEGLL